MSSHPPPAKLRIVVADDEPFVREVVAGVLVRHGFEVEQAANGQQVIGLLERMHVDLLITDIRMPGLDGLELVDLVRQLSPHTSSILMTGAASLETARMAAQRRAYDYLPKPFSEPELIAAVNAALARKSEEDNQARQRELQELFKLSQEVREAEDAWQMIPLIAGTALVQTRSSIGYLATFVDSKLQARSIGSVELHSIPQTLEPDDPLCIAAERNTSILMTREKAHPLSDVVGQVLAGSRGILNLATEALIVPLSVGQEARGAMAVGRLTYHQPYTKGDFQLLSVLGAQCGLLLKNAMLVESLQRAYVGAVHSMARAVEAKDRYTHGHSQRVADLCCAIGRQLGVSPKDLETLNIAAGLHDIGKLSVPDSVLNKPECLTPAEWVYVRRHPIIGAEVLAPATFLADVVPLVLHHHERYDGGGYPHCLAAEQISPLTHIIIAADAWDAMTSDRPYRPALSMEEALQELDACKKQQFHPDVAEALIRLLLEAP